MDASYLYISRVAFCVVLMPLICFGILAICISIMGWHVLRVWPIALPSLIGGVGFLSYGVWSPIHQIVMGRDGIDVKGFISSVNYRFSDIDAIVLESRQSNTASAAAALTLGGVAYLATRTVEKGSDYEKVMITLSGGRKVAARLNKRDRMQFRRLIEQEGVRPLLTLNGYFPWLDIESETCQKRSM